MASNEIPADHSVNVQINDNASICLSDLSVLDINAWQIDSNAEILPTANSSISLARRGVFTPHMPDDFTRLYILTRIDNPANVLTARKFQKLACLRHCGRTIVRRCIVRACSSFLESNPRFKCIRRFRMEYVFKCSLERMKLCGRIIGKSEKFW